MDITLPDLGENIEGGDVLSILATVGKDIKAESAIIEIETEKATLEVPCPADGRLEKILVKKGDFVKVGQVFAVLTERGKDAKEKNKDQKEAAPIAEGDIKEKGASQDSPPTQSTKDDTPAVKSDSPSPKSTSDKSSGEEQNSDQTLAKENSKTESEAKPSTANPLTPDKKKKKVPAAPSVRRFAYEIGIEITDVPGSGPGGRISIDDVKAYSKKTNSERSQAPTSLGPAQRKLPDFKQFGAIETQDMNKIREITAAHLTYSWQSIPHVTQFGKADITDMEALRQKYKKQVEAKGGKLTITAILAKVVSTALKEFPQFNSSVDMDNKQIIQKKYYNVGLAVDTPNGLIVPVIKNTDKKNITELALEISDVAKRSKDRKITPTDLQGGTFTITNLGGIGGTAFTPVVNWPEVAILGVSKSEYEPVYKDGKFVPRLIMPLSLSYDHRVIDGADGARFLNYLVNALQDPFVLALEG